jgi:multiple sugar transport system substrate-binding protein
MKTGKKKQEDGKQRRLQMSGKDKGGVTTLDSLPNIIRPPTYESVCRRGIRFVAGVTALLIGLLGTPGIGSSVALASNSKPAGTKVALTYITHWNTSQAAPLKAAIQKYEKQNPNVTITVQEVTYANLLTTLETEGSSASGPTIAGIYDLWLPELVKDHYTAPAPAAYSSDIRASYGANVTGAASVNGQIYGYPQEIDVYALDYNKALFKQAGISGPPKTWTELLTDASKLTKKSSSGSITQQGFELINSWDSGVVHPWLSLVESDGGAMISGSYKPLFTSTADEAVTNLYSELVQKGYTSPALGTQNPSGTGPWIDSFTSQKSAMVIMANWWESELQQAMGANFKNVGVAPIPVGPNGTVAHGVSYEWLDVVNHNASTAQQQAAWAFLKWLNGPTSGSSGSSAMGDALMDLGAFPSRNSDLQAHKAQLSSPYESAYVQVLKTSTPYPDVLGGAQLTDEVETDIEAVEFKTITATAAMAQAQNQAEALLKANYSTK